MGAVIVSLIETDHIQPGVDEGGDIGLSNHAFALFVYTAVPVRFRWLLPVADFRYGPTPRIVRVAVGIMADGIQYRGSIVARRFWNHDEALSQGAGRGEPWRHRPLKRLNGGRGDGLRSLSESIRWEKYNHCEQRKQP